MALAESFKNEPDLSNHTGGTAAGTQDTQSGTD